MMLRIDQGTANLATPLQVLLKQITTSLTQQGLLVTSVAVSELYAQEAIRSGARRVRFAGRYPADDLPDGCAAE
ncbi:MAG: hypothetical protein E6J82_01585 [Deltaproteobacteria bacterium]|nr:MAG: hypothetical protein E6J82_01585 [Deltaproteobacteria bacterium]